MIKIFSGLIAAILIAVAGFFGFQLYTQYRVASEIDAAFEQIRATGGKASHGKVSFDLLTRTVTVADIAAESAAQPAISVKIANFTASAVSRPDATRFTADSIEAADIEVNGAMTAQAGWRVTYKVPRITVMDYSGPAALQRQPASSSIIDLYRFSLEQLVGVSASSVTIPSIAATMNFGDATPGGGSVAYSGLSVQGVRDGKIAAMKAEGLAFTVNMQQAGKPEKLTGNISNIAAYDFDARTVAAVLDPQKANDDQDYRVYRQISTGGYTLTNEQGLLMRIGGVTVNDVSVRPSRLQIAALMTMLPPPGAVPAPAQAREMIEKVAGFYESLRIGNAEMRGMSMDTPQGPFKLAAMRFNLENGKFGEFALEDLDARTPSGPFKVARFALKSLDIANLLRMSALFANPSQKSSPDQALGMMALIEGVELKGLVAPFKDTGKPVNIDTLSLDWGQFVGPIPSKARLTLKMSTPLDARDPAQKMLVAAGLDKLAIDFDLGATWTEASHAFALEPVKLDFASQFKASARVSFANVPRQIFSVNPTQAMAAAAQLETGTIQLTVQDIASVDRAIALLAHQANVSREAFRTNFVEEIRANGKEAAASNPDATAASEALARFIETSGQTLNLKLTPLGKVPALQLIQLLKTDPLIALAQFRIEASTGL
jgi:hypothetical protein